MTDLLQDVRTSDLCSQTERLRVCVWRAELWDVALIGSLIYVPAWR